MKTNKQINQKKSPKKSTNKTIANGQKCKQANVYECK